jgi:hypothetical protein
MLHSADEASPDDQIGFKKLARPIMIATRPIEKVDFDDHFRDTGN